MRELRIKNKELGFGRADLNSKFLIPNSESGVIAIFLASILSIVLVVTTMAAARLAVSEVSQSSQVDRSEQAYYAAIAGIEEASRRLDVAPLTQDLGEIFFEGAAGLNGDYAVLTDGSGNRADPLSILEDKQGLDTERGQLAWRKRRIYGNARMLGEQQKDVSIQLDTSSLVRRVGGSRVSDGDNDYDYPPAKIHERFMGFKYCWQPLEGVPEPEIEFSVTSWEGSTGNVVEGSIKTEKVLVSSGSGEQTLNGPGQTGNRMLASVSGPPGYSCTEYTIGGPNNVFYPSPPNGPNPNNQNRRYVFRVKPLFRNADEFPCDPIERQDRDQGCLTINYQVELRSSVDFGTLTVDDNTYTIDVMGQSGEIRRRIVATKDRTGKLLGIFDFVLYSGGKDPDGQGLPLCKAGVQQTGGGGADPERCIVIPADNQ